MDVEINFVEIDFIEFNSWEDFDLIAKILSKDLKYRVTERLIGPDVKICKFSDRKFWFWSVFSSDLDKEFCFWLVHDDMIGNLLRAERVESLEKLKEIAEKVEVIMKSA